MFFLFSGESGLKVKQHEHITIDTNDDRILNYAIDQMIKCGKTVLVTGDKNLSIKAMLCDCVVKNMAKLFISLKI